MRRNARVLHPVHARSKFQRHVLTGDKKVLVVDGESGLLAFVTRLLLRHTKAAENQDDQYQLFHFRFPSFCWDRKGGGFPVLTRERTVRGNLQRKASTTKEHEGNSG